MKRVVVVVAAGAVIALLTSTFAESARKPGLRFTDRLGPDTPVAPLNFATATARCPRGYVATGGGAFNGAIEPVTDGPTTNGRGWEVSGFNPSDTTVFDHNAVVRCAKGNSRLRVRSAVTASELAEAKRQFLQARKEGAR
jgi:hypothetical protein